MALDPFVAALPSKHVCPPPIGPSSATRPPAARPPSPPSRYRHSTTSVQMHCPTHLSPDALSYSCPPLQCWSPPGACWIYENGCAVRGILGFHPCCLAFHYLIQTSSRDLEVQITWPQNNGSQTPEVQLVLKPIHGVSRATSLRC
jgi:hypothetical protein